MFGTPCDYERGWCSLGTSPPFRGGDLRTPYPQSPRSGQGCSVLSPEHLVTRRVEDLLAPTDVSGDGSGRRPVHICPGGAGSTGLKWEALSTQTSALVHAQWRGLYGRSTQEPVTLTSDQYRVVPGQTVFSRGGQPSMSTRRTGIPVTVPARHDRRGCLTPTGNPPDQSPSCKPPATRGIVLSRYQASQGFRPCRELDSTRIWVSHYIVGSLLSVMRAILRAAKQSQVTGDYYREDRL